MPRVGELDTQWDNWAIQVLNEKRSEEYWITDTESELLYNTNTCTFQLY